MSNPFMIQGIQGAQGANPVFQATPIDAFGTNGVSGSLEDMALQAASNLSASIKQTDAKAEAATAETDFSDPISVMHLNKIVEEGTVKANFIISTMSKIPKGLEILNK
jgi:hypothetical protein